VRFLISPWIESYEAFAQAISQSALLVSPFITREPLERLTSLLKKQTLPKIRIVTNLSVDNLLQRSTDVNAIAAFCRSVPTTTVWHLPGLHAKVYIADNTLAIVTSANLTAQGLNQNYEYGIEITDASLVAQISEDLKSYADLGSEVTLLELDQLAEISQDLYEQQIRVLSSSRQALRQEFDRRVEAAHKALMYLRAKPTESTNAIFSRTIVYLLRNGPLSTQQLHPLIQDIHPDVCDDSIDRIINGVRFGKRWKHMVRNAQQSLQSQGIIRLKGEKWHLVGHEGVRFHGWHQKEEL
jgi:hypothetical protein